MNKINLYVFKWFLCKINLNVFFFSKNNILNKLIIFCFYTQFFKTKKFNKNLNILDFNKNLNILNFNKNLNINFNYFLFNFNQSFFLIKHIYTYSYMFLFFNQKFIEFNKLKFFNKFLNKYYVFFFASFKIFFKNELVFYKNLNINFIDVAFKNLRKFNKINNPRFFRKLFFSKIHFFKLKKIDEKINYFNKQIIF